MYQTKTQKALSSGEITITDIKAIKANHPRLYAVAMCRIGPSYGTPWSLESLAMNLDVSKERVRQLEAKAIALIKLRKGH